MDVSKKTLHKIHSRRRFIENTNEKLRKYENKYNHYQNQKEHMSDYKQPSVIKRAYNQLTKPYELHYHITHSTDERGKDVYKQGFRFTESSGSSYHQRGILHKVDDFRRTRLHSDVSGLKTVSHIVTHSRPARFISSAARYAADTNIGSKAVNAVNRAADTKTGHIINKTLRYSSSAAYKAASVSAEGAFRTGLAAETGLIAIKDSVHRKTAAELESKFRQEAQGDGDKAGVLIATNSWAAAKGLVHHIQDKQHYKPLQKSLNQRMTQAETFTKKNKHITNAQNKQFIKTAVLNDRFLRKTGREKLNGDDLQYILSKTPKTRLIYKADKREFQKLKKVFKKSPSEALRKKLHQSKLNMIGSKSEYHIEKLNEKLTKLQNRKNKTQKKLYKLKNRSLASKAAAGVATNLKGSLRNQAMQNGAADNDAVMAVDKISTIGRRQLKKHTNQEKIINKRLKKHSAREDSYYKKSAKKKKKATKKRTPNYNAQKVYKELAAKKAKKAARKRKASKFGLAVIGLLMPIIIMPLILTACLGIFANPDNFGFLSAYYGAKESDLSQASNYYQELSYDMNKFVLSVPDNWKDNLAELNIPSNYTDDPTRFIFGNSDRLHSDTTYDFDKHKLYSFLCAYLFTKDDDGEVKNWYFNDEVKNIIKALFNDEYEFKSFYDNTSHWELRNAYEFEGYYLYDGCFWNGEYGLVNITYPDALPEPLKNTLNENTLYFNVTNGEVLDYNNNYAATGWYFQNHYYNTVDNSGHTYEGWYNGEECHFGVYRDDGSFIPFPYVIQDENWVSFLHKYDRINECSLFYTVNRKKSFDDCIREALMSLEDGESVYSYYQTLSTDTEPQYYGLNQIGTSPTYYGYLDLMNEHLILHGYGWEMKNWNESDCDFNTNDQQHSGISIIQNSGSNVYAMVSGNISEVGDNYFILRGWAKQRDNYLDPVIVYVNVDTSGLSEDQEFKKGQVITHTNNRRQEMKYLDALGPPYFDRGFVSLIDNDAGYDYLNISLFDYMDYEKKAIDPEIVLSLVSKGE